MCCTWTWAWIQRGRRCPPGLNTCRCEWLRRERRRLTFEPGLPAERRRHDDAQQHPPAAHARVRDRAVHRARVGARERAARVPLADIPPGVHHSWALAAPAAERVARGAAGCCGGRDGWRDARPCLSPRRCPRILQSLGRVSSSLATCCRGFRWCRIPGSGRSRAVRSRTLAPGFDERLEASRAPRPTRRPPCRPTRLKLAARR